MTNTDQKAALDALEVIIRYSKLAEPFQDEMQEEFDVAVIRIRAALRAAQVEKVEGLAEALNEFDSLPEQDTTSLIILKAARLQLARQESLSTAIKGEK